MHSCAKQRNDHIKSTIEPEKTGVRVKCEPLNLELLKLSLAGSESHLRHLMKVMSSSGMQRKELRRHLGTKGLIAAEDQPAENEDSQLVLQVMIRRLDELEKSERMVYYGCQNLEQETQDLLEKVLLMVCRLAFGLK